MLRRYRFARACKCYGTRARENLYLLGGPKVLASCFSFTYYYLTYYKQHTTTAGVYNAPTKNDAAVIATFGPVYHAFEMSKVMSMPQCVLILSYSL